MSGGQGRLRRMGADLSGREWARLVAIFGFILAVNVLGWGIFVVCAPSA